MTHFSFSSVEVKKFLFLLALIIYLVHIGYELYINHIKLKEKKREYAKIMFEYYQTRDREINKALDFTSFLQQELDQIKMNYNTLGPKEKALCDDIQCQLDQYRANIIINFKIINL